ncbi:hypothetical protein HDU93_004189 [Gonapodya sp. JEL0774]|nr:hypothetical protein HDU93_004189 [Gonapodya sp. JEL0774]
MATPKPTPIIPETVFGRLTLFCSIVEAIVIIILETIIAYYFQKSTNPAPNSVSPVRGIPVYLVVFCLAQVFAVILCWDAKRIGVLENLDNAMITTVGSHRWIGKRSSHPRDPSPLSPLPSHVSPTPTPSQRSPFSQLYHKNTIQIIGWILFNVATFFYAIFQYAQMIGLFDYDANSYSEITDPEALKSIKPALVVIPVILGVFQLVDVFLSWKLYQEFGWRIYKKIGADPRMKNMYRWYQIFLMLLKFDFFFAVSFTIQFLALILQKDDPEFAITVALIPIAAIITALAVYGVRKEDRRLLSVFMVGLVGLLAYFIFKIWRTYNPQDEQRSSRYQSTRKYLTFFGGFTPLTFS